MTKYNHKTIEQKWQKQWQDSGIFKTSDSSVEKKYYVLDMFPYPSGAGLHVGHPKGYIATDIISRYKRMQGYEVLHPMGWDAFGLPAENYALKNKILPSVAVKENIKKFKQQLSIIGLDYDWSREINTTDPKYYKWTQWIFLKMFKRGLAYQSNEPINWCPSCKTGIANEDLEAGKCEQCGSEIEQKAIRQWVLRITDYADRLLQGLERLNWEDSIKEMQRNWIGKSEGSRIKFQITNYKLQTNYNTKIKNSKQHSHAEPVSASDSQSHPEPARLAGVVTEQVEGHDQTMKQARGDETDEIEIFTTRPDTLFGATYIVLAPEHELIKNLESRIQNLGEVKKYIEQSKKKTELERTDLAKEKTGVELKGIKAINPATREEIPIWIADYVLMGYGTGAIMSVPAHDQRDFEFAKKYNLPIKEVVKGGNILKKAYIGEGIAVNSGEFDGLETHKFKEKIVKWLEKKKLGKKTVNYRLKDWIFSRQRYWGEPIPLVFCPECKKRVENYKLQITNYKQLQNSNYKTQNFEFNLGEILNPGWIMVPEEKLPLELPEVESYEPTGTGESPLANIKEWVETTCPKCGGLAKRETNTMPQWAGSCWYYLRYIDPKNNKQLVDKAKEKIWSPVDLYVGGAEHATRHLIYARFWHKFLYDIGVVTRDEPFQKLYHVGLILAEDGRKMSKRWGNVINPDEIVEVFGADTLRIYEMFMGPFSQAIAWDPKSIIGMRKFLDRVWGLVTEITPKSSGRKFSSTTTGQAKTHLAHKTIKKVTEDIENFKFNTAISQLMIYVNELIKEQQKNPNSELSIVNYQLLIVLLSPFAPHLCEELWSKLGHKNSIFKKKWPEYDEKLVKEEEIELVIQINGKVRDKIMVSANISEDNAKKLALESKKINKLLESKEPKKMIFVQGKLINIVI